jgi:hypothetical protein
VMMLTTSAASSSRSSGTTHTLRIAAAYAAHAPSSAASSWRSSGTTHTLYLRSARRRPRYVRYVSLPHTLRMRYGLLLALLKPCHRDARMCSEAGTEPRMCSKAGTEPGRARVSVQAKAARDASWIVASNASKVASKASKARPSCPRSGEEYIRSAYVSIREQAHTSAYVSIRHHTRNASKAGTRTES